MTSVLDWIGLAVPSTLNLRIEKRRLAVQSQVHCQEMFESPADLATQSPIIASRSLRWL